MRKLQYVLMALSVLCFAVPAFADGGTGVIDLAPIGAGLGSLLQPVFAALAKARQLAAQWKHWRATPAHALAFNSCWFWVWPSSSP